MNQSHKKPEIQKTADRELEQRIESTLMMFRKAVIETGITITADERISEQDAATLLCYAPDYLKQKRSFGTAPPHYERSAGSSRVSYRLIDLATWTEKGRKEL